MTDIGQLEVVYKYIFFHGIEPTVFAQVDT